MLTFGGSLGDPKLWLAGQGREVGPAGLLGKGMSESSARPPRHHSGGQGGNSSNSTPSFPQYRKNVHSAKPHGN